MKKFTGVLLGVSLLVGGIGLVTAQDTSEVQPPPKVLALYRGDLKPGKAGTVGRKERECVCSGSHQGESAHELSSGRFDLWQAAIVVPVSLRFV